MWIPLAREDFRKRLQSLFPDRNFPIDDDDKGLVLVKCTEAAMAAKTKRILVPNVYAYKGDDSPTFGIAKWKESIEFFLDARDAPTLASELERHKREFDELRKSSDRPPASMMTGFMKTLVFFQEKLEEASKGDVLAEKLLQSLKPINSLRDQWKMLESNKRPVREEKEEKVAWDGLELQIVKRNPPQQPKTKSVVGIPTFRKQRSHENNLRGNKRPRARKMSPVMSSLDNPLNVPIDGFASADASQTVGMGNQNFIQDELLTYSKGRNPGQNSLGSRPASLSLKAGTYAKEWYTTPSLVSAPQSNAQTNDVSLPGKYEASLLDDVFEIEKNFLSNPDDMNIDSLVPEDWRFHEVPPPTLPFPFPSSHNEAYPESIMDLGIDRDDISIFSKNHRSLHSETAEFSFENREEQGTHTTDLNESKSVVHSNNDKQTNLKSSFAPTWMLVKLVAVASLFGLHTFNSPQVLSIMFSSSIQPADLPDPPAVSNAPCPQDEACIRIMEAIYPVFPAETLPLVGVPGSCQNWAREWLASNKDIMQFTTERIRQRYALAVFYCETDGASWDEHQFWVTDMHECDWNTLSNIDPCNRREQFQILRNDGQKMRGNLPAELSMISSLWEISLSDNLLSGNIPTEFAKLSELDTFSVGYNLFTGPFPEFLWGFEDMVHLDVEYNSFRGTIPNTLHLTSPNLRDLYLSYNVFSGTLPDTMGQIDWQRLHLDGNAFHGPIPEDINAGKMKELLLNDNRLTGTFPANSFATQWSGRKSKLETLTLYHNNLEGNITAMCNLVDDPSVGRLDTFAVDLEKMSCQCCSGPP